MLKYKSIVFAYNINEQLELKLIKIFAFLPTPTWNAYVWIYVRKHVQVLCQEIYKTLNNQK
jgi:hypothetical protein